MDISPRTAKMTRYGPFPTEQEARKSGLNRHSFCVTWDITTEESATDGDVAERGLAIENASLSLAIAEWKRTRGGCLAEIECTEPDSLPCDRPNSIRTVYGMNEYGESETRTLHIPETITRSSARRIARLCGVSPTQMTAEPRKRKSLQKPRAHLITLSGKKVLVHRQNAALYLQQWRAARLRIKLSTRTDGTKAYFCRHTNETITVNG